MFRDVHGPVDQTVHRGFGLITLVLKYSGLDWTKLEAKTGPDRTSLNSPVLVDPTGLGFFRYILFGVIGYFFTPI